MWPSDGARSGSAWQVGQLLCVGEEEALGVAESVEASQSPGCSALCRSGPYPPHRASSLVPFSHLTHKD